MSFQLLIRLLSVMNIDTSRSIISVAEAHRSYIFELFFNLESRDRKVFNLCRIVP